MLTTLRLCLGVQIAVLAAVAAGPNPVGLIVEAGGAKLLRGEARLGIRAVEGELIYPGDRISVAAVSAKVAHCQQKALLSLAGGGDYVVADTGVRDSRKALVEGTPLPVCDVPAIGADDLAVSSAREVNPKPQAGTLTERIAALPATVRASLEAIEQGLRQNVNDLVLLMSRASLLLKSGLEEDALAELQKLMEMRPDASVRIFVQKVKKALVQQEEAKPVEKVPGKTWALLVGISKFENLSPKSQLKYADADALEFAQFLTSPRGGSVPEGQIRVLLNEKATRERMKAALEELVQKAGKNDNVIVLIATHGLADEKSGQGFVLTYDSFGEDLKSTAIEMKDIQALLTEKLANVANALIFVDICRAGSIGTYQKNRVNTVAENVLKVPGQTLGFMASRSGEYSWEGSNWGGGHGAFSFFLLQGLNGEADTSPGDGVVTVSELVKYVRNFVEESTRNEQHPAEIGVNIPFDLELADLGKPGIEKKLWRPLEKDKSSGQRGLEPSAKLTGKERARQVALEEFYAAIDAGRIIPETPGSAYNLLRDRLKPRLNAEQYQEAANELRIALVDRGQQTLIRYLEGEKTPQRRENFADCAMYFDAALLLVPESGEIESKSNFCKGRMMMFNKNDASYDASIYLLESAIRGNPKGAYSYNALGINFLETAKYDLAVAAFEDAIRLAPHWAYAYHNLALAQTEQGNYDEAIRAYQNAIRMGPQYAYPTYGLGLLRQRLNQNREAEAQYQKALKMDPKFAFAANALGSLYAQEGKFESARKSYEQALQLAEDKTVPRHNLGLLLAGRKGQEAEGVRLWRENGDYVPSRLLLAQYQGKAGKTEEALENYRAVVRLNPSYDGARIEMAKLLSGAGRHDEAIVVMETAVNNLPGGASASAAMVYETFADVYAAAGRREEARENYEKVRELTAEKEILKRIAIKSRGATKR